MTKTKLTKQQELYDLNLLTLQRMVDRRQTRIDELEREKLQAKREENISAGVGFLVLLIVFLLGNLLGHWISNQLRQPTWHSPKGCPIYVGGTNGK